MTYRLTVVDDNDVVLGVVPLDGYDLRNGLAGIALVDDIASAMGTRHIEACAQRESVEE